MNILHRKPISGFLVITSLFLVGLPPAQEAGAKPLSKIEMRLNEKGELAPLPEAKPLMIKIAAVIESPALKRAIKDNRTLEMMRERLKTSLFHLNFKFEVESPEYPYDPPFEEPFPFRPTLEAMDEASRFLKIVEKTTGFKTPVTEKIDQSKLFDDLRVLFRKPVRQGVFKVLSKPEILEGVVDAYDNMQNRLETYGETASFPEFEEAVIRTLEALKSKEVKNFRGSAAFDLACQDAINELETVRRPKGGEGTRLQNEFNQPFPYRRTLQAIEKGVMVLDLKERLKYPTVTNWHEVELSWFHGNDPKLLELYHFNRYKYQSAGLLADNEVVIWPYWGDASLEDIIKLRAAPLEIIGVTPATGRADRHHNSPIDFKFHDINHARRMWGYDKRKQRRRKAKARAERMAIYREQEKFIGDLLEATNPNTPDRVENEIRKQMRILIFETFHETALTPDRESLIYDLTRGPATPQPFEVQRQYEIKNLEDLRTFDGNLKSGADKLALDLLRPTIIRYFYDRAPGYLANVDNKFRWGFYDSVFDMSPDITLDTFRTPHILAKAAIRLFELLGEKNHPSQEELVKQINDHSGQPELYNYFSNRDQKVIRITGLNALNVLSGDEIHENWRLSSLYDERWKPTNAKLIDGTIVSDKSSLQAYLKEKKVPAYLHSFFRLETDPVTGFTVMFEDIRNLPGKYLASKDENIMSGAKGITAVDRIWHKKLHFSSLESAERWLVAACQTVHQAVLDRNANGARNNPVYNKHWLLLPPQNQKNDLELVRLSFNKRAAIPNSDLTEGQYTLIKEAILRLQVKIARRQRLRTCLHSLSDLEASDQKRNSPQ